MNSRRLRRMAALKERENDLSAIQDTRGDERGEDNQSITSEASVTAACIGTTFFDRDTGIEDSKLGDPNFNKFLRYHFYMSFPNTTQAASREVLRANDCASFGWKHH